MVEEIREIDWLIDEWYVPSSVERKKAILMYFFIWIVAALSKEQVTIYEYFHLKQAIGRWMLFFVSMMVFVIFIFMPYFFWVIPVIVFIFYMIIWIIFAKQAWEWRYVVDENKILLPIYASLWWWVVSIFELDVLEKTK